MSIKTVITILGVALMGAFGATVKAEQEPAEATIVSADTPPRPQRVAFEASSVADPDEPEDQRITPSFRGEGTHKCQSRESIGHTCTVSVMNRNDCEDLFSKLKNDDCCPRSEYGGHSIEFTLNFCSPL